MGVFLRRRICLSQQISLEKAGRAWTCLSLGSSKAPTQHGELNSTENWPRRRALCPWITTVFVIRSPVLPARPGRPARLWEGNSRLRGGRKAPRPGSGGRSTGSRGFRPPVLWRREGSRAGSSGIRCRDGVAAAAHRAALVAGGAGAGLQPGAHDPAGHQHLPGGHRAQVPTLLGERGRARPTRLRCPGPAWGPCAASGSRGRYRPVPKSLSQR